MKNLALSGLCAIGLTCAGAAASVAQEEDEILSVVKSGVCPKDLTPYDTVKYSVHCVGMDERSCDINDKGCFEDAKQCWDQVNLMNKQIFTYNNFVKNCPQVKDPAEKTPKPPTKKSKH